MPPSTQTSTIIPRGANGSPNYAAAGYTSSPYAVAPGAINPPVSTSQPAIPAATLTSTAPLNIPSTANSTGASAAAANLGIGTGLNQNQQSLVDSANAGVSSAESNYNATQGNVTSLINEYLDEGADEQTQLNAAGVPGLLKTSNDLTTQYNTASAQYNAQYDSIINAPTGTLDEKNAQITDLQAQHAASLASVSAQQAIAQNDYTTASTIVQNAITIKYAPIQQAITYGMQFLANNKDILTAAQTNQFSANLQVQQQQQSQNVFFSQLNATTGVQMIKDASENGADSATLAAMSQAVTSGGTIADIAGAAGSYLENNAYTYQYDPNTQTWRSYDPKTGTFEDGSQTSPGNPTISTDSNSQGDVTGTDGATYDLSSYATDPSYGSKIAAGMADIKNQTGTITDANSAQAAIDAYAKANGVTPSITGSQVITAAQQAGIDPNLFAAQLQLESGFGTSTVATNNNNFGGVKFANQKGASKGTTAPDGGSYAKFDNAQDGLNAEANIVASHKQTPTISDTGQTQTTQQKITMVTALKASLPSYISSGIGYITSTGDGYIDSSKITDPPGAPAGVAATQAENYAKQYGLAYLTGDQASAMQDADTALTQINNIQNEWNAVAPTSGLGAYFGSIPNQITTATHTGNSTAIKAYINLTATSISTLNAITGSKRLSAFSEELSTDSIPTLAGFAPNGTADTLSEGNAKLDNLRKDIAASIYPIMPNVTVPLSDEINDASAANASDSYTANGQTYMVGTDGLYYPTDALTQ